MTTVMTSRTYTGDKPPSLPPRQPSFKSGSDGRQGAGVTHVRVQYMGRQRSQDQAPPPPPPGRGNTRSHSEEEVPPRNSTSGKVATPGGIQRKAFETNSFINRNTAKAYSQPDRYASRDQTSPRSSDTPPLPPSSRPPARNTADNPPPPPASRPPPIKRKEAVEASAPPAVIRSTHPTHPSYNKQVSEPAPLKPSHDTGPPLPSRPPKSSSTSALGNNRNEDYLEQRFRFHSAADFPPPDSLELSANAKNYPSIRVKHHRGPEHKGLPAL